MPKEIFKKSRMYRTLKREIEIHKQLKHDYIVRLYTNLEDQHFYYLVMEYIPKDNLFNAIRKYRGYNEKKAFWYFIQTVVGVYFLHKNQFIHRDLKPENLLIDNDNRIKICDFGWTCEFDVETDSQGNEYEEERNTYCGTPAYMAPEMRNKRPHGHQIDTWALGILLYELVHGREPFVGQQQDIINKQKKMQIKFTDGLSENYEDLVRALLQYESANRITLVEVFAHPWVRHYQQQLFPDWSEASESEDATSSSGEEDSDDEEESEEEDEEEEEEEESDGEDRTSHSENLNYVDNS